MYQLQRQQQEKIRDMARRLSAVTNLGRYTLVDVPGWRMHASAGFVFAPEYLDALEQHSVAVGSSISAGV